MIETDCDGPDGTSIEDEFGIRILGAFMTAADGMIEIQYQVLDKEKAGGIASEETSPIIVSGRTTFDSPGLAGHGHTHHVPDAGKNGFVLLANSNGRLQEGDEVTVKLGDLALDGVVLE